MIYLAIGIGVVVGLLSMAAVIKKQHILLGSLGGLTIVAVFVTYAYVHDFPGSFALGLLSAGVLLGIIVKEGKPKPQICPDDEPR